MLKPSPIHLTRPYARYGPQYGLVLQLSSRRTEESHGRLRWRSVRPAYGTKSWSTADCMTSHVRGRPSPSVIGSSPARRGTGCPAPSEAASPSSSPNSYRSNGSLPATASDRRSSFSRTHPFAYVLTFPAPPRAGSHRGERVSQKFVAEIFHFAMRSATRPPRAPHLAPPPPRRSSSFWPSGLRTPLGSTWR